MSRQRVCGGRQEAPPKPTFQARHLPGIGLMVVPTQMNDAMDDESLDFFRACQGMAFGIAPRGRCGNDDFAQKRTFAIETRCRLAEKPGFTLGRPVGVG